MRTFSDRLVDPRVYRHQIESLHQKQVGRPQLYRQKQGGVSLASMIQDRRRLSRVLARTIAAGEYEAEPASLRTIRAKGKARQVFAYSLVDRIVHGAVAALLDEVASASYSPCLYSYRSGLSAWRAVIDFAAWVRAQYPRHSDPRDRHLYVLRRDVTSYTDSIPVHDGAPLWGMLRRMLGDMPEARWKVVEAVVRPAVMLDGEPVRREHGLPMGQPISGVLANLYLNDLDRELEAVPGGFYARYCDDFLFAHPSADEARDAAHRIGTTLRRLGLGCNASKRQDHYLTPAARPSAAWPESFPAARVDFLGTSTAANGTVALDRAKARRLLRDVEARLRRSARLFDASAPLDQRGALLCAVANRCLDPDTAPLEQQVSAALARRVVTDRDQLKQLDYRLARMIVRTLTGDATVRAFRRVPYRKLRRDWQLVSLQHARNRWGRRENSA